MKKTLLLVGLAFACSCKTKEKTTSTTEAPKPIVDCSSKGMSFLEIKPIFDANCISCHGYNGADGLNFMLIEDVRKAASEGELLGTIKHQRGYPAMPQNAAPLDKASIELIECWIKNGMKQ